MKQIETNRPPLQAAPPPPPPRPFSRRPLHAAWMIWLAPRLVSLPAAGVSFEPALWLPGPAILLSSILRTPPVLRLPCI